MFPVRGARPGKQVNLAEQEIRYLCVKSRQIFLSQPILLELEAPIKICGTQRTARWVDWVGVCRGHPWTIL